MTLDYLVGQTLIFGIPGAQIRPQDVSHFRETHAGGLILFRHNFVSPQQIKKLIATLENTLERRLLVTIDHEGGRIVRFPKGVTHFPDNASVGQTGSPAKAGRQGKIEAVKLWNC